MKKTKIRWFAKPEAHDYPAAQSYLSLLFNEPVVNGIVNELKATKIEYFKAKDIFRASQLSLLGISNSHVQKNCKKIKKGKKMSPLLLVRHNEMTKVLIADGYHRLCAVYIYDEDALIPCKIVCC